MNKLIKTMSFSLLVACTSTASYAGKALWVGTDFGGIQCNNGDQSHGGFGPFDFVTDKDKITVVETFHFTREVEQLIKPMQGYFPGDFDYTLRALPNHHRALLTIIKYQLQLDAKLRKSEKLIRPVECYLQRAIHFSPNDAVPYTLYAYYLHKVNRNDQVGALYEKALQLAPGSAKIQYSYGLFLVDTKQYDKAVAIAKEVYKNKAPNGLKNKLVKLNLWK